MPDQAQTMAVLNTRLGALHDDVTEMRAVLGRLADAITKLALIEQQQGQTSLAIERAFKTIEKVEVRCEAAEKRVAAIEQQMPTINKTSGWVEKLFLGVVGAVLMLLFKQATGG